jgi:hypothetical protein
MTPEHREWEGTLTDAERVALTRIVEQCHCDVAYKDRGLKQPDCAWCDHGEEVLLLMRERNISRQDEEVAWIAARTEAEYADHLHLMLDEARAGRTGAQLYEIGAAMRQPEPEVKP